MRIRYNLIKTVVGISNVSLLFYDSLSLIDKYEYKWWEGIMGIFLMFLIVKGISFMRGEENIWIFLISMTALIPFNIKLTYEIVNWWLIDYFVITKILFGGIVYLSLLSAEEIFLGIVTRILWPIQRGTFMDEKNKMDEKQEAL